MMKREQVRALAKEMRDRRERIFSEVAETEDDLHAIEDDREIEPEERAQNEWSARLFVRLDDHLKQEIEEIDEALRRIAAGTYGVCVGCGAEISRDRLEALPASRHCIECARAAEKIAPQ